MSLFPLLSESYLKTVTSYVPSSDMTPTYLLPLSPVASRSLCASDLVSGDVLRVV